MADERMIYQPRSMERILDPSFRGTLSYGDLMEELPSGTVQLATVPSGNPVIGSIVSPARFDTHNRTFAVEILPLRSANRISRLRELVVDSSEYDIILDDPIMTAERDTGNFAVHEEPSRKKKDEWDQ